MCLEYFLLSQTESPQVARSQVRHAILARRSRAPAVSRFQIVRDDSAKQTPPKKKRFPFPTVPPSIFDERGSRQAAKEGEDGERIELLTKVLVGPFLRLLRDEAEHLNRPPRVVHAKKSGQ